MPADAEHPLSQMESTAARTISAVLTGFGFPPAVRMKVLRASAEAEAFVESDEDASFEAVRLHSLGVEQELRKAEGGGLSSREFAERLGLSSPETIRTWREDGQILAWQKDRRNLRYPAWQIHRGALLQGLPEVLARLREKELSPLSMISFFISHGDTLDGKNPLQLMRSGNVQAVIDYANRYGEQGA